MLRSDTRPNISLQSNHLPQSNLKDPICLASNPFIGHLMWITFKRTANLISPTKLQHFYPHFKTSMDIL